MHITLTISKYHSMNSPLNYELLEVKKNDGVIIIVKTSLGKVELMMPNACIEKTYTYKNIDSMHQYFLELTGITFDDANYSIDRVYHID